MENQVIINVQGYGQFSVPANRVAEILAMLRSASLPIESSTNVHDGQQMILG